MKNLTPNDAPVAQVLGTSSAKDLAYLEAFEEILTETPHSPFHLITHWPAYTKRVSVARFLSHYEIFKLVQDLPGDILELGVSPGVSFFTWHKLLEVFLPADTSRKVVGFDSFEGLTDFSDSDGGLEAGADKRIGGWSAGDVEGEIFALTAMHNADNIFARERLRLVKGRVQDALPGYLESNPGTRISLLHLDMDLYEPTKYALDILWDRVLPGGVVVFDEFRLPPWGGEATAWDELARERGLAHIRVREHGWAYSPDGYVVKE
jgi:Macrocin-O-methyltransferase (TylF)